MEAEPAQLQSLAARLATKSNAVPRLPPSEMPSNYIVGMPLKWDSPPVAVDLYVELPFRLGSTRAQPGVEIGAFFLHLAA